MTQDVKKEAKKSKTPNRSKEFFINFANERPFLLPPKSNDFVKERLRDTSKVPEVRSILRKLLDQIIQDQELKDTKELQYFIKIQEQYVPKYKVKNGKLIKNWTIGKGPAELLFYPNWLRDLSFNLIDYLRDSERDIRKIKKCKNCGEYYISTQLRANQKYCSSKCKRISKWPQERWNKYMRNYRPKKPKGNKGPSEADIKNMVNVLHIAREEAIEQIKEDEKM